MFNRNPAVSDSPLDSPDDPAEYVKQTKAKIEACIVAAVEHGAEVLVVPDIGCGVFLNDPTVMGGCFGALLKKYDGDLRQVVLTADRPEFIDAVKRAYIGEDPREPCKYGADCRDIGDPTHAARKVHPTSPSNAVDVFDALIALVANPEKVQKPMCRYGKFCRTKTVDHLARYEHPESDPPSHSASSYSHRSAGPSHASGVSRNMHGSSVTAEKKVGEAGTRIGATSHPDAGSVAAGIQVCGDCSTATAAAAADGSKPREARPICKYGEGCYSTNAKHLADFAHPWKEGETAQEAKLRKIMQRAHEMLTMAKDGHWINVFAEIKKTPDIVNIRPETRRFGVLHYACYQVRHNEVERLVNEFNADVNLRTQDGHTPLEVLEERIRDGQPPTSPAERSKEPGSQ
jgi:hypothetical protein